MIPASIYRPPDLEIIEPIAMLVLGETALQSAKYVFSPVARKASDTDSARCLDSEGTIIDSIRSDSVTSSCSVGTFCIPAAMENCLVRSLRPVKQVITR